MKEKWDESVRVSIAEDGALFREGLQLLLEAAGHTVVGVHSDGSSLLASLPDHPVDAVVLDVRMPPGDEGGLTTAADVRRDHPEVGILLLSHYGESHYMRRMLEIGTEGIGYRLKERIAGVSMLNDTLARIEAREIVIEPLLAGQLVGAETVRADSPVTALGDRERDVLRLMAEGKSNGSIAAELFVSVKAVEKHSASIFTKLGIPDDAALHNRRVLAVLTYLNSERPDSAER